ncbi:MAG: noeI 1 [Flavipsychrobacter sp.]|nr:noeI 1 [Flavipsychrobacter sp.]
MVARRLAVLLGKADLNNVNQILDIGSWHLGQSIEFATIFEHARVDAFEPVPASYELCKSRRDSLDRQRKDRIGIHNIALTNKTGKIPFYAVDPAQSSVPNVGASSMFRFMDGLNGTPFNQNLVQQEIMVQATTLDKWCKDYKIKQVDIMWVDVQGAELLVFKGAEKILKNTRIIMTEVGLKPYYEGHTLKADIDAYLNGLGFKELHDTFELNGFDYEANTIYVNEGVVN